jgi:hypothetical protein
MPNRYDKLFERYVKELRTVRDEAQAWWDALLKSAGEDTQNVRLRWPCGAVSYPRVIAVYRKYYLECNQLNEENSKPVAESRPKWGESESEADRDPRFMPIAPFLLDNFEPVDPTLGKFMQALILSPIGMNPDAEVC